MKTHKNHKIPNNPCISNKQKKMERRHQNEQNQKNYMKIQMNLQTMILIPTVPTKWTINHKKINEQTKKNVQCKEDRSSVCNVRPHFVASHILIYTCEYIPASVRSNVVCAWNVLRRNRHWTFTNESIQAGVLLSNKYEHLNLKNQTKNKTNRKHKTNYDDNNINPKHV